MFLDFLIAKGTYMRSQIQMACVVFAQIKTDYICQPYGQELIGWFMLTLLFDPVPEIFGIDQRSLLKTAIRKMFCAGSTL